MQITNVQSFAVRALGTVFALAVLAGAFGLGYGLGLRNAGDVSDHGGGADRTAGQLEQAATNQRQLDASIGRAAEQGRGLADSLDRSRTAVDRSKAAADGLAGGIGQSQRLVEDAVRILRESQQILRDVRRRGESKTGAH